ncbi:HAD-IA family hydrolase [Candidatus Woesearchaeota archaeon]|nr:HAD-IA family hydrolase [Candidatus Woesearchaeota archaeon]
MSEIKYVCFDIGGVANVRMPREEVISRGQQYFGQEFSSEKLKQMMFPIVDNISLWGEFQKGEISAQNYLESALSAGGFPTNKNNPILFRSLLEEWCGVPYQPVLDLVERLKQNGYPTSVLSNNNEIMYNTPSAEIKNRVDAAISSHEIGRSKPHWEAYCILLGKIKATAPGEVLLVDDKIENVQAAKRYGLQGFHFRSKELNQDNAFDELMLFLKNNQVRV